MDEVKGILAEIRAGTVAPIYFLQGEEAYYIDKIEAFIAQNVLDESEKGFNQMVLYGHDTDVDTIVSQAKRYPMMAERQVVIVREAQHLSRNIEKLTAYAANPQPTTVLVLCYKYKKLDKRKKLHKAIAASGKVFDSKKIYDDRLPDWIMRTVKEKGRKIGIKAATLLAEYLGNDLGKIDNELKKLLAVLPPDSEITDTAIAGHIGVSKDFNNFELKRALGEGQAAKAAQIVHYFSQNPKDHPFVVTVSILQSFFTQLLQYHALQDRSPRKVASVLRINPYFVNEIQTAARRYPMKRVSQVLKHLRTLDLKGKGVGGGAMQQADLLKELLVALV